MIAVAFVYLGLATIGIGMLSLLIPLRRLRIPTRKRAVVVTCCGALLVALGWLLPAPLIRVADARTHLDRLAPAFQFNEVHRLHIEAPPATVYTALRRVTAGEVRLFRTLIWIRRFGREMPENILNVPKERSLIDVATETSFLTLAEEVPRELVVGTVVTAPKGWSRAELRTPDQFIALTDSGFAKATMNFRIEPDGDGRSLLTTETRVFATDTASRRRFAAYWRVIFPGSALIRRSWLRAIKRRAESGSSALAPPPTK